MKQRIDWTYKEQVIKGKQQILIKKKQIFKQETSI